MFKLVSECPPGKRGGRPLHSVPSDLPTYPRHLTRSSVGNGRPPAIFPCGHRTNATGELHTPTLTHTHVRQEHGRTYIQMCSVPPPPVINIVFHMQMIHEGVIIQSKLSMSFKPLRDLFHCTESSHSPFRIQRYLAMSLVLVMTNLTALPYFLIYRAIFFTITVSSSNV